MLSAIPSEYLNGAGTALLPEPLFCNEELPLRAVFHPLGFSLEIVTNSRGVLETAGESWGLFHQTLSEPALQLRVHVLDDGSHECPPRPSYRAQRQLLITSASSQNICVCDLKQRFACAWLTQAAIEHRSYFRYHFLEAAALSLIAGSYAVALHAACIAHTQCGVLLCGDSGAGKSSLAFACARAGWTYISDDASYLIYNRTDRLVVGNSHRIRFRPSAAELFPEVRGHGLTPRAAGKPSIELSTSGLAAIATATESHVHYIVFLNRNRPGPSGLVQLSSETAWHFFHQTLLSSGADRERQVAALRNLVRAPVVELRYRELDWAVDRLELLVREGR